MSSYRLQEFLLTALTKTAPYFQSGDSETQTNVTTCSFSVLESSHIYSYITSYTLAAVTTRGGIRKVLNTGRSTEKQELHNIFLKCTPQYVGSGLSLTCSVSRWNEGRSKLEFISNTEVWNVWRVWTFLVSCYCSLSADLCSFVLLWELVVVSGR